MQLKRFLKSPSAINAWMDHSSLCLRGGKFLLAKDLPRCAPANPTRRYKVFYVYSAANVLVAARICPLLHDGIPIESITTSWFQCFEILKRHSLLSKSAKRCIAALEFLDRNIVTGQEQQASAPSLQMYDQPQVEDQQALMNDFIPNQDVANYFPDNAPTYFGDGFYNTSLMNSNDLGWLHSVPMDLFQYDSSDIFRQGAEPFYNL